MTERVKALLIAGVFLLCYYLPVDAPPVLQAIGAGLALLQEYARLHVLTCLVPAFFIAGTIAVYVKKGAIIRLLGPEARKALAYPVGALSGGVLAVCSCTILPLFTGIYKRGAGIGPATAFLFTGPAINITAILLTGGILGWHFALGRLAAAMIIAVLTGLLMAAIFRDHDRALTGTSFGTGMGGDVPYPNAVITVFFLLQIAVLIAFGLAIDPAVKAVMLVALIGAVLWIALRVFRREDNEAWLRETWDLLKKILPLLLVGVFIAGIIDAVVPSAVVVSLVGRNTLVSNAVASLFGAFMYFATLTEVPIIQKLMGLGMADGPAMTLFLTGNALSLPSMIVLVRLMGARKASTYFLIIISLSALAGWLFGALGYMR